MQVAQQLTTVLDGVSTTQLLGTVAIAFTLLFVLIYIESRLKKAAESREQLRIRRSAVEVRGRIARFSSSAESEYVTRYTFTLLGDPLVYTTLSYGYDMSDNAMLTTTGDRVSFYATPESDHVFELRRA